MKKLGLSLQKHFEMQTSGERGIVSDFGHPPDEGRERGSKRANLGGRPLRMTHNKCRGKTECRPQAGMRFRDMG